MLRFDVIDTDRVVTHVSTYLIRCPGKPQGDG
jgi:hypothetical protein